MMTARHTGGDYIGDADNELEREAAMLASEAVTAGYGPKQESAVRQLLDDQRTTARKMAGGTAEVYPEKSTRRG